MENFSFTHGLTNENLLGQVFDTLVETPLGKPASYVECLVWIPTALLLIHLISNVHTGREWVMAQALNSLNPFSRPRGSSGSRIQLLTALAIVSICWVNDHMKNISPSLSLSLFVSLSFKKNQNKWKLKCIHSKICILVQTIWKKMQFQYTLHFHLPTINILY